MISAVSCSKFSVFLFFLSANRKLAGYRELSPVSEKPAYTDSLKPIVHLFDPGPVRYGSSTCGESGLRWPETWGSWALSC